MTDQESMPETNTASPSIDDILNPKKAESSAPKENSEKTKAEDTAQPKEESAKRADDSKQEVPELEKLKKRLEDTQKWGNTQRQATLQIIKNLKDKGLSEEDISDAIGGKEVFDKVSKGLPVEQELDNPAAVITQTFSQQIASVEAAFKELGHTDEELKEFMEAFNVMAYDQPEHREEMYRRATSGEGNVAAYALKVGREKLEEYRLSKDIKVKGVKAYEQELRERIRAEVLAEASALKEEIASELGGSSGKPRLVGGAASTPKSESTAYKSVKDILGQ